MEEESNCVRTNSSDSSDASDRENRDGDAKLLDELKCPTCNKVFSHPSTLSRHVASKHGEKKYPCNGCGKSFNR